jgi:hypothetical protein
VNEAYISAISALSGSAIGALASLATTWLTQRHQNQARRLAQDHGRREQIFVELIDLASKAFVDALLLTLRHDGQAAAVCVSANSGMAEKALNRVFETYYQPKFDLQAKPVINHNFDILREFAERCRAELR